MPVQTGYFDTLKSAAGKIFTYLSSIILTGTDGKTINCTQDTDLDEAVAMSSKATVASPMFTGTGTFTKASAGDVLIITNGGATPKPVVFYSGNTISGFFNVANIGGGHEGIYFQPSDHSIHINANGAVAMTYVVGSGLAVTGAIRPGGYTVATLPAGTAGMKAYVTDALAPAFLVLLASGGVAYSGAQFNGSQWVGD